MSTLRVELISALFDYAIDLPGTPDVDVFAREAEELVDVLLPVLTGRGVS